MTKGNFISASVFSSLVPNVQLHFIKMKFKSRSKTVQVLVVVYALYVFYRFVCPLEFLMFLSAVIKMDEEAAEKPQKYHIRYICYFTNVEVCFFLLCCGQKFATCIHQNLHGKCGLK